MKDTYLTTSRRFEFSASHRLAVPGWSEEKNTRVFGPESGGEYGHGHNYVVYLALHGRPDEKTGMAMNISRIKEIVNGLLREQYDHKFLNVDSNRYRMIIPTPENLSAGILLDSIPLFAGMPAVPVVCHLAETPWSEATAYRDGRIERSVSIRFSAARRTYSPRLTDEENRALFGICSDPAGHGHGYELRCTLEGSHENATGSIVGPGEIRNIMTDLHADLDHRNLNVHLREMGDLPMTTECLSRYLFRRLADRLPLSRVRLEENEGFFVECHEGDRLFIGLRGRFFAAHRLHSPPLTNRENLEVYGKCNNPGGHGHEYRVEATFGGELDERTGILYPLEPLTRAFEEVLSEWDRRHLDRETGDFGTKPSTGENIVTALWQKLEKRNVGALHRLRLWETPNNRFTLRRGVRPASGGDRGFADMEPFLSNQEDQT